jgi:hypothetical protein
MKKYEIHLPLSCVSGEPIGQEQIKHARDEVLAVFGSFAVPNRRAWRYDGSRYIEIMKIEVVTRDTVTTKRLKGLKNRLEESLHQSDVLITSHDVQVI